jgi:myo-inositol-1(or 4)-monophosphatase
MDSFFCACLDANREIARHIYNGLSQNDRLKSTVGAGGDISSGIDLEAEAIFIRHLSSFGRIESEESGTVGKGKNTIIIDPLDGSSNILSDFPYYGTSVAFVDSDGDTTMAVICNLATKEIFFKEAGAEPLRGSLFGDEFSQFDLILTPEIGIFERAYAHPGIVSLFSQSHMKFRAPGAVALSLVYACTSRFFLYFGDYRSYDFAAGLLFCEDLEVDVNDEYVIVSKDKTTLEAIQKIVAAQRSQ